MTLQTYLSYLSVLALHRSSILLPFWTVHRRARPGVLAIFVVDGANQGAFYYTSSLHRSPRMSFFFFFFFGTRDCHLNWQCRISSPHLTPPYYFALMFCAITINSPSTR